MLAVPADTQIRRIGMEHPIVLTGHDVLGHRVDLNVAMPLQEEMWTRLQEIVN